MKEKTQTDVIIPSNCFHDIKIAFMTDDFRLFVHALSDRTACIHPSAR